MPSAKNENLSSLAGRLTLQRLMPGEMEVETE